MTRRRFEQVHELTAKFEGGWSNHPADPGGKTMYGVTERVYHAWLQSKGRPQKPVRAISMAEALDLYFEEYWLKAGCPTLATGVDRMVYDAAVNSGVVRSRRWLMQSIGGPDEATIAKLSSVRLGFLHRLKTWKTFGKGWTRRVKAMETESMREAVAVRRVVEDAAARDRLSTTEVAGGIGAVTAIAKPAQELVNVVTDTSKTIADVSPAVWIGLVAVAAFAWVIRERRRKRRDALAAIAVLP